MASVSVSRSFNAPLGRVFEVFSDIEHCAEHIPDIVNIEKLSDGPMGVGFHWRETRIMMKREATEEMEITEFEPNRRYLAVCDSCGARYESEYAFAEEGGTTRVTMTMTVTPVTFMAKLMSPIGFLFSGLLRKCLEKDMDALRTVIEGESPPEVAAV